MSATDFENPKLPFKYPPIPFIQRFASMLDGLAPLQILDAGCGTGRSSIYLADRGHNVIGVNKERDELLEARSNVQCVDPSVFDRCLFVEGDIRNLMFRTREQFDVVLANNVLHLLSKEESLRVMTNLRIITKRLGMNAVSGYLVEPGTANVRNNARCFKPNELRQIYQQAGWDILDYTEHYHPIRYSNGRENINSTTEIIALKPEIVATRPL